MEEKAFKPVPDVECPRHHKTLEKSDIKVSIIIPVYKRERYLFQCFNSAINQTLKEIEIIIVDKAEKDAARKVIDYFEQNDSRVIAPHIKNNGYGASCNIGLSMAHGEYVLILESDDYIEPEMCQEMYSLAKSLNADVVKTPYTEFFNDGRFQDCPHRKQMAEILPKNKCFSAKEYGEILEIHASLWSCLYRREYLQSEGIKFVEADGAGYVDVGFRIDTLVNTDRIAWLDIPYYNYRVDSLGSSTNNWNVSVMNQRWKEVHEYFAKNQTEYDQYYGPHLIVDEYINTAYRNQIAPLTTSEREEIEYNFSFVKEEMIRKSKKLTEKQKADILRYKRNSVAHQLEKSNQNHTTRFESKPNIKIFVSHRIDQETEKINNPLYVPVRCGAAFDTRTDSSILGDDTGDNISEKRTSFCELTVQYWAWKNVEADYYGLCHYRRFIDFSGKRYHQIDDHGQMIESEHLSAAIAKKYGLLDAEKMTNIISKYDAITIKSVDVSKIPTPSGYHNNVYDFWTKGCINLIEPFVIDKMLDLISMLHPEYYEAAKKYLEQNQHRGYNTFILKKDLFFELCQFEFDILFSLEKEIDTTYYSDLMFRTPGYLGEILSAIFIYKISHDKRYRIASRQLVAFTNCTISECEFLCPAFIENNVPIVFVSSLYNVPYLGVCIETLIEYASQCNNYDIIVLTTEIDETTKIKLQAIVAEKSNFSLRFYNPCTIIDKQNFKNNIDGYISLPFYKAFLAWVLPFYKNAIILDSDLVIKSDVARLLSIDWKDNYIAAVRDHVFMGLLNGIEAGWREYSQNVLRISNPFNYINAGVIVMNLENIRNSMTQEKALRIGNLSDFKLADQDLINVLFHNKVVFLDPKWNYFVPTNLWVKNCIEASPRSDLAAYKEAGKCPYIIHFANRPKPWQEPSVCLAEEWWVSARKGLFYEQVMIRLNDERTHTSIASIQVPSISLDEFDGRTGARKFADKILPKGTRRREIAKKILPKGSMRWRFCKQIYYIFKPEYRPVNTKKGKVTED